MRMSCKLMAKSKRMGSCSCPKQCRGKIEKRNKPDKPNNGADEGQEQGNKGERKTDQESQRPALHSLLFDQCRINNAEGEKPFPCCNLSLCILRPCALVNRSYNWRFFANFFFYFLFFSSNCLDEWTC